MNRLVVAPLFYLYSNPRNPLPKIINLEGGYQIKAFKTNLLEPFFDFYKDSFSEYDKQELLNCRYAIYFRHNSPDNDNTLPGNIVQDIYRITNSLRVVKRTRSMAAILYLRVTERRFVSIDALTYVHKPNETVSFIDTDPHREHFIKQDARKIRSYWHYMKQLYDAHAGNYHRVLNALLFFEIGHYNSQYKPRLINFVTCLESLFNTGSEQINYSLKIRCSYFLERNPNERITLAKTLKEIYNLRSLFVHGQSTPGRILRNIDEQKRLLMDCEDIVRKCLQKIFDKNLINTFGTDATLNIELSSLELGNISALS